MRSRNWRIYAVVAPTPIVQGPATLTTLGANYLTIRAHRPGRLLVHVHFTPYWAVWGLAGCVAPAGAYTQVNLAAAGKFKLVTSFAFDRIGADSPRCTGRRTGS
jgi:hypothetical protein